MDAVITYVNGLDPLWQEEYAGVVGMDTFLEKRFRDWGTLKYLLRGIEKNMPFVRNVHLVVSGESQVPSWVDRSNLHIVTHRDIFPENLLPVFNSQAIEMFLHRIEGLDERYLYFNDDCFPVLPFTEDDFYPGGKPALHMSRHLLTLGNGFRRIVRRSFAFACESLGRKVPMVYLRPPHTVSPMLRSQCEELYSLRESDLIASITPLREDCNFNQYIFTDYMHLKGLAVDRRISNRHFSLAVAGIDRMVSFLGSPDRKMVCINDVKISAEKYESYRRQLIAAFETRFPQKSRFEL